MNFLSVKRGAMGQTEDMKYMYQCGGNHMQKPYVSTCSIEGVEVVKCFFWKISIVLVRKPLMMCKEIPISPTGK